MSKRIIRITENDITKIVKRVLAEQGIKQEKLLSLIYLKRVLWTP
jgi:hypothetical protein